MKIKTKDPSFCLPSADLELCDGEYIYMYRYDRWYTYITYSVEFIFRTVKMYI